MNVGDPKKAAVLGAVALVVVGVAVMQAVPKGPPKGAAPAAASSTTPGQPTEQTSATPTVHPAVKKLQDDPFAHPSLKAAENSGGNTASGTGDDQPKKKKVHPPLAPPDLGEPGAWERFVESQENPESMPGVKPGTIPFNPRAGEITGTDRESVQIDKKVLISVEGIVSVDKPKAFLSTDGKEAKTYKPGDWVGTLGQVTRITESEVEITRDGKKYVVQVGKKVKL